MSYATPTLSRQEMFQASWQKMIQERNAPSSAQQELLRRFNNIVKPQLSALVDRSQYPNLPKKRGWIGILMTGRVGVLHIGEGISTSRVYNCQETDQRYPALLHGEQVQIFSGLLNLIRRVHTHPELPAQIAFRMVFYPTHETCPPAEQADVLLRLLVTRQIQCIRFGNIGLGLLDRPDSTSPHCSFKRNGFPIEIWSHEARLPALNAAIRDLEAREGQLGFHEQHHLTVLREARGLEDRVTRCRRQVTRITGRIADKEKTIERKQEVLNQLVGARAHPRAIQGAQRALRTEQQRKQGLMASKVTDEQALTQAQRALAAHKATLNGACNSYEKATFQIQVAIPNTGLVKRYTEGGRLVVGDPNGAVVRRNDAHLRFGPRHLPLC